MPTPAYLSPAPDGVGTKEQLLRADERARNDPRALTDADISLLASYDVSLAKRAYDARADMQAKATEAAKTKDTAVQASADHLAGLVVDLAVETKKFVGERLSPIEARLGDLELQLATLRRELETTRAALDEKHVDQGVWRKDALYRSGDLVSDRGSAWVARQTTNERPGESSHWRLAAKGR